jgi:flagellar basal-body rod protein FlgG
MLKSLYVSALGLQAQKEQLDAIATNFTNANTTAYKRRSVDFSALLDRSSLAGQAEMPAGEPDSARRATRTVRFDLAQGDVRATGRALDVAIVGAGFLEVDLGSGSTGYSRGGSLQVNADGLLTLSTGRVLKADIRVPTGTSALEVNADGRVSGVLEGDQTPSVLGQLSLVSFANPEALEYLGEGLFVPRLEGVNEATTLRPGEQGGARLAPRSVEGSNVRMVDEMVAMMLMQRVYELNTRVIQAADEMMSLTNSIRRG